MVTAMSIRRRPATFNTAIYIRLSQEDGDKAESNSVTNQKKLLLDYIEKHEDLVLYDIFIDDGYTGSSFERPDFQRMMQCVDKGQVNCIVVKDTSRFGRDNITMGLYFREFAQNGIRVLSYLDNWDSFGNQDNLMIDFKSLIHTQYVRDTSAKINATVLAKQQAGEFIGSFASYGYKKAPDNKNKLIIDEYPATIVKRIFDLYIKGHGKQSIARMLTNEGIESPSEYKKSNGDNYINPRRIGTTKWTYSTIDSILKKEIYTGKMVQGTKKNILFSNGKQLNIAREDYIVVPNTHEAIIDEDTWEKTQKLLEQRYIEPNLMENMNIFAGQLRCADCGQAMTKVSYPKAGGKEHRFCCGLYKRNGKDHCSQHMIPYEVLKGIVLADVRQLILSMESQLEELVKKQKSGDIDLEAIQLREVEKVKKELEKVARLKKDCYEDFKEDLISKGEYVSYREDYVTQEEKLIKRLKIMEAKLNVDHSLEISERPEVKRFLESKDIDSLSREVTLELIDCIKIHENQKVSIVYNLPEEIASLFSETYVVEK